MADTVEKFTWTLRPGGVLLTGHTELFNQPLPQLQVQRYPQAQIYRLTDSQQPWTGDDPQDHGGGSHPDSGTECLCPGSEERQ